MALAECSNRWIPSQPEIGQRSREHSFPIKFTAQIGPELVDRVDVSVSIQSQDPPFVLRRKLQDESSAQTVEFDAAFEIQSVVDVNDVNRYIVGSFNTVEKKAGISI